ncbi:macro domain-containing protein [Pontixanthobacter gangjinensis]|uniref:Macro domain-containing protein n=1 Tax=Christiangramia aestuarii TaxID=1028746 RepID=A0A7K1LR24_9FLAO|nr:macro domain-containing protein [Christiangramia aestuarii]MUP43259.1 macro domain-containing protein [Christiangramia aestuarii]
MICTFLDYKLEVEKGDIANQPDLDVVVNAANAELAPGGGVAGALHSKAGPELYRECKQLAPIKPGEAVITKAYNLPNKNIIHCLGPVYGKDKPEDELLASCYRNSLQLAEENSLSSIGFPGISTGIFGYPPELAVEVVFNTVLAVLPGMKHLKTLKFVVFNDDDLHLYESKLKDIRTD